MSRKIIIDCDNTFGVEGCDVDDGLAIIYTLAQENIELLGVTTTFGNNKLDIVYPNTVSFMRDIKREDIEVYKGEENNYKDNQAARFLAEISSKHKGEISIIALGSLTNLYHAWKLDRDFYNNIKAISTMGGITSPLVINDRELEELNFSCDVEASLNVLKFGKNLMISTGNTCLDGFFTRDRFQELKKGNNFERWLYQKTSYWFHREKDVFKNDGIYIWDVLAAAALLNPKLFTMKNLRVSPDSKSIKSGLLFGKGKAREVALPVINNVNDYIENVYESFRNF